MKLSQANGDARKISSMSQGCWTQNCWWGGERKAINQKPGSKGPDKRPDSERTQKTGFCRRSSLRFSAKEPCWGQDAVKVKMPYPAPRRLICMMAVDFTGMWGG